MKKKIVLLVFKLLCLNSFAQEQEIIDSGRPGNAISVFTVGKNNLQIEAGIDFFNKNKYVSSTFLRYGITEVIELNGGGLYNLSEVNGIQPGLSSFVGAKFHIFKGDTMMPSTALQVGVSFPNDNMLEEDIGTSVPNDEVMENVFTTFLFVVNYAFNERLSYTLNFGVNLDLEKSERNVERNGVVEKEEFTYFEGVYAFNLLYKIDNKWAFFIEPYGSLNRYIAPKIKLNLNSGLSYLVNKDLQFDLFAGHGINNNEYLTLSGGISWRVDFK